MSKPPFIAGLLETSKDREDYIRKVNKFFGLPEDFMGRENLHYCPMPKFKFKPIKGEYAMIDTDKIVEKLIIEKLQNFCDANYLVKYSEEYGIKVQIILNSSHILYLTFFIANYPKNKKINPEKVSETIYDKILNINGMCFFEIFNNIKNISSYRNKDIGKTGFIFYFEPIFIKIKKGGRIA